MSTTAVPPKKTNRIGLEIAAYKGGKTTLCAGCGHNSVSERLVECFFEMGIEPWSVAKFSGIGCSSKSPAYFLGMAHGFNSVHGRAPSVATGALVANRNLLGVTVSGDGDTASIGIGQFVHMLRRNVRQIYIIENNGVYGLTKGQFSATADIGSKLKTGVVNDLPPIDCCLQAIHLGATLVARSFSGDKRQLQAILKAAIAHRGLSVIDVISPCVTFNDHEGSTKSYSYMKEHGEPLHELDFIPACEDIAVEIAEGEIREVEMHGGARLRPVVHAAECLQM
ncbi:MAG TPA: thiamine pyrophosphate-dependent enzyme, partial [Bryobacteraceae bacterium]|nr:thiamine pyrophosphate-dependent enzyme [Bryobacteraceae bacterium]